MEKPKRNESLKCQMVKQICYFFGKSWCENISNALAYAPWIKNIKIQFEEQRLFLLFGISFDLDVTSNTCNIISV